MMKTLGTLIVGIIAALLVVSPAHASTRIWDGGGLDNNWSSAANWDGDTVVASGDSLHFTGSVRLILNNDLAAGTSINGITFDAGAGAFTLLGNRVQLDADINEQSGTSQTINFDMIFGGTRTVNTASGNIIIAGVLSDGAGPGGLTKIGAFTLTLTGANTFTGLTIINRGSLRAAGGNALGGTGSVTISSGGTLLLAGDVPTRVNDPAPVTMDGGKIDTGGLSETLGTLTITSDSIIDMGAGNSVLRFADSAGLAWNGRLSIWNWSGKPSYGGGTDQLFFGDGSEAGLTPAQLTQITFYSDAGVTKLSAPPLLGTNGFAGTTGEVIPKTPVIQPSSAVVGEGGAVSLTVVVIGTEPLHYQWEHNREPIADSDGPTLRIINTKGSDAGDYRCTVSNGFESVISDTAVLEVRLKPRIVQDPISVALRPKAVIVLTAEASGYEPLSYQWQKDGVDIPDQTEATLFLTLSKNTEGIYRVRVTNEIGSAESKSVEVRTILWGEIAGTYQGLCLRDNSSSPDQPLHPGRVTLTINKQGRMSCKLEYRGLTHAFTGTFTPELNYQRTILRKNQGALNLLMSIDPSGLVLHAEITETLPVGQLKSNVAADIHGFDTRKNPAPQAGRYTMQLNRIGAGAGGPAAPGFVTASISKAGKVVLCGKMPDGTILNSSALLHKDGTAAWYDPLYKAVHPYAGHLRGIINFDILGGDQAVTGALEWSRPAQQKGIFWPLGFTQGRSVEGSIYIPPLRGIPVLNLPLGGNSLSFVAEGSASFIHAVHLIAGNHFAFDKPNAERTVLKLQNSTGLVSGSFYDSTPRKIRKLYGVVLQAQNEISGFFLEDTYSGMWTMIPN